MITFGWPWMLTLLALAVPALLVYRWLLSRRRSQSVGFTQVALLAEVTADQRRWRRHLGPALMLLTLVASIIALSRPSVTVDVASSRTSIVLAMDISRSMCAVDVAPNRLTVAQQAAAAFIESQADTSRIGLVAFAGFAEIVVPPTNDRDTLVAAVEGFSTSFGTAIGSATLKSLDALADVNPDIVPPGIDLSESIDRSEVWAGDKVPDIIVVLTDGANTQGVDPLFAAEQAADRGVRVFTIGFGTSEETTMVCNPAQAGADFIADPFGEQSVGEVGPAGDFGQIGGFGGASQQLIIDEPMLRSVAGLTAGSYYRAEDAAQLIDVFLELPAQAATEPRKVEITVVFATVVALCGSLALGRSLGRRIHN